MARKLKYTQQVRLASSILDFIDWELEKTEQEKAIESMLGDLEQRVSGPRRPKIIYTGEVMKLRGDAMETLKNQIISHTSGVCEGNGSVKGAFKRLHQQRQYSYNAPNHY